MPAGGHPRIVIETEGDHPNRQALRAALYEALSSSVGGPWRAVLRPALVYSEGVGAWWWSLTLTKATGESRTLLVDPPRQTPAFVAALARKAVANELLTVVCSVCGRVRLENGSWHELERLKLHARLSHGLCPECALRLYPAQVARIRGRGKDRG